MSTGTVVLLVAGTIYVVALIAALSFRRKRRQRQAATQAAPNSSRTADGQPAPDGQFAPAPLPGRRIPWGALAISAYLIVVILNFAREWDSFRPDYRVIPPSIPEFESSVADYAHIDGLRKNSTDEALAGRAVIIDRDRLTLHPLMRDLPKDVLAGTPSEVEVVIWVETRHIYAFDLAGVPERDNHTMPVTAGAGGLSPSGPTIPAYRPEWTVTVIDLEAREIRRVETFAGAEPPGWLNFKSQIGWGGQVCVYCGDDRVAGAEILYGESGHYRISTGTIVGIVGPPAWDETRAWLLEVLGAGPG